MTGRGGRLWGVACGAGGLALIGLVALGPKLATRDAAACISCDARHQRLSDQVSIASGQDSVLPTPQMGPSE